MLMIRVHLPTGVLKKINKLLLLSSCFCLKASSGTSVAHLIHLFAARLLENPNWTLGHLFALLPFPPTLKLSCH